MSRFVLVVLVSLSGCAGYHCDDRAFSPTGELEKDLLGAWDWSTPSFQQTADKWAYTFHADGGLTIAHDPYGSGSPIIVQNSFAFADGGYVWRSGDTVLDVAVSFEPGALLAKELGAQTFVPHAALTCQGAGLEP